MPLRQVGVQMTADGAAAFNRAMADGDKAVAGFGKSATEASGKVSGFGQIATGALRQVGAIATNALADAGRAVVGFVGDSVKKAGDFEAGMNTFGAVTGSALKDSGKSLKDFSDLFIQLGRDLPVSTADVQQAAIELAKGGIDPATIAAGALKTALSLAAAGGIGLADSANILSKQLGVWVDTAAAAGEKSAFLTDTANLLSQAANVTTSDVDGMALGLANVGGVAKVAGLGLHETIQTLALISPSFSSASDAGTSFKTFLSRLIPTTKPAIAAMTDLGLYTKATGSAFYDQQGKFVGMEKASALLQAATSGLTESQRLMAFQTIFGTDAIRTAAIISEKGAAGYADMGKQMDAAGTVASQAAARQQGFNTAMENAKGSLEALQLTVGAALIPVLSDLLNTYIAPGINTVTAWAGAILSATDPLNALVTSIDSVLPGFAAFATFVSDNLTPILVSIGAILASVVVPAILSGAAAFGAAVIAGAPLILGLAAIGAAAYALYTIWNDGWTAATTSFMTWATGVGTQLAALTTSFVAWVTPLIPEVLTALQGYAATVSTWILIQAPLWGAQLLAWGIAFVQWVTPVIGQALTKLGELAAAVGGWIVQQAPKWAAQLVTWGQAFVTWVTPYIAPALAKLGELAAAAIGWVVQQVPILVAKLEAWGQALVDWIGPKIPPLLTALGGLASSAWGWVTSQAPVLLAKLETWGQSFVNWIGPTIPPLLAKAGELASEFLSWIGQQAAPILASLKTWATSFVAWIAPATVDFLSKWPGMLNQFLDWIGGAAGPLLAKLGDWAVQFVAWIVPMIPGFIVALGAISVALMTFVGETVVTLLGKLSEWGAAFGTWISTDAIPALVKAWPGFLESLNGLLDKANGWMSTKAAELGHAIVNGIINGLNSAAGALYTKLNDLAGAALSTLQKAFKTGSPSRLMADEIGTPIVQGIQLGVLNGMPNLLAAMRASGDETIQEIVGFLNQDGTGRLTQAGADAINALIAGMQQVDLSVAFAPIQRSIIGLFTPPDTHGMIDALAAVKGTVTDLGALLNGNNTGNGSIEGDTKTTFTSIVDLTHQAWEQVRAGISNAVIDARATVDTATKAILQVSTESFTKLRATSDLAWGQIHKSITDQITSTQAGVKLSTDTMQRGTTDTFNLLQTNTTRIFGQIHLGITDQITRTQAGVKLSTDAMQKSATATWGLMGADAAVGWQKVKANIETPLSTAKDTVATASAAMQESLKIPAETQDAIFETYRHVTDTMIAQLEKVTTQIDNVTEAWGRLSRAKGPQGPQGPPSSDLPASYTPPARALGGPVLAGMAYLVGEHGKETFVPQTNGAIVPANTTSQLLAGMNQRVSPPASAQQITNSAIYNNTSYGPTFQIEANYRYQSEQSLMQTVKTLQMLYPST